jgi:protein SCO1/2
VRRLALLALAVLGLVAAGCGAAKKAAIEMPATTTSPYNGYAIHPPVTAPAFSLVDQSGRRVGAQDMRGHWLVVTFMYTHCPDVCPLIADNLRAAMSRLPNLRAIAISVDPAHDTKTAVHRFLVRHRMPPAFHYVTGTSTQLRPVWAKYHVAATSGPMATISHSSYEVLIDPQGKERILYDATMKAADLLRGVHGLQ